MLAIYTPLSPDTWVPSWGLWYPCNLSVSHRGFPRVKVLFWPFPGPTDEAVPEGPLCFLGNHSVEKVNFLSVWSLPHRLFIFGAVVIAMMTGSVTVAAVPWLAQLDGRRDRGQPRNCSLQPRMAGMGAPSALLPVPAG